MNNSAKISIRNLYKIFGPDPTSVLDHVKNGVGKPELLSQYGHVLGLEDISVDIHSGDVTVIMGLSGSGKSTLIRHFNRLIEPTAGEIIIDGEDVTKYDEAALRRLRQEKMSMVFQKFALLPHRTIQDNAAMPLTVRDGEPTKLSTLFQKFGLLPHRTIQDNAAMPLALRGESAETARDEANRWLDRVGLGGYEQHYPYQLSGGMQQRVGIARALTSNSEIMLMDEAFSALDPLIRTDMQNLLLELQQELHKTIVFITHDLDEALKLADHLVILKDGKIIQQGEPQHILLNPCDSYIIDFISDINRARVLRVRSVMEKTTDPGENIAGVVDYNDNLEHVIAVSEGESNKHYCVMKDDKQVGLLHMKDLLRALVPTAASEDGPRMQAAATRNVV